jgi:hypothetical protein
LATEEDEKLIDISPTAPSGKSAERERRSRETGEYLLFRGPQLGMPHIERSN